MYILFFSDFKLSPACAPSVLLMFINMVLFSSNPEVANCDANMYSGQEGFQKFLVILAVLCIPWMMLSKPFLMMRERKKQHYQVNVEGDSKFT